MKSLLILFLLLGGVYVNDSFSYSSPKDSSEVYTRTRIGVTASTLSGYGLSVLKPINEKAYISITGILAYYESQSSNSLYSSLGLEYQHRIKENEKGRFFTGIGAGVYNINRDQQNAADINSNSLRFGTFIGYENPSTKLVRSAITLNYFAIFRGRVTYVGIGAGISLTIPVGKKVKTD